MPDAPLIAMVPVNLRTANDADGGNVASAVLANLATNVEDPAQRLATIRPRCATTRPCCRSCRAPRRSRWGWALRWPRRC